LLEAQAQALNPGFVSRMRQRRPYVRVKVAASLDGRTALTTGESKWITGEAARNDVQRLRAASSAILTGIGTVLADDPALTVRVLDIGRQPLRVVVDSRLRMPPTAQMLRLPGTTLVATAAGDNAAARTLAAAGAEIVPMAGTSAEVDLTALLRLLAEREVNEVLVEAGPRLSGALLAARLVDEIVIYLAPRLLGEGRGMFDLPALKNIADGASLDVREVRAVGSDWRVTARLIEASQ
jgi:diaminohydroxyphosphoribosylaminopyrimidine deaminase/5-amino-6-(5-phosphoribosylamino)uracil reductase